MLGRVTGSVWATRKSPGLGGQALLTVETERGQVVCADCVGAGAGERVLVAFGGAARGAAGRDCPVDAAIVAIVDAEARPE